MKNHHLLSPMNLGDLVLANRVWMAPLTRCRAGAEHIPHKLMVEYYEQRASAGLIIAEATAILPEQSAFWTEPGIFSEQQIEGWKAVTEAVHKKNGRIFLQIWHGGRACHSAINHVTPVAPSAIAITNNLLRTASGKIPYEQPRELRVEEIPTIVGAFKQAALNAKHAGFDGVEVHTANGYLIDEFLRDGSNKRTDQYGGSMENRARFLFDILTAVSAVWSGSETGRIGLRLSPLNSYNSMIDSDPIAWSTWLAKELNRFALGYLHVMRSDFLGLQSADVMPIFREHYRGLLVGNMGYSADEADGAIASGKLDAVAFGVNFISNPDLPLRFARGAPLNAANPETFYTQGSEGYTDYPFARGLDH